MADRIPIEEMTTLKPASDAKSISDKSLDEFVEQLVAFNINYAANCHQHSVVWLHQMPDDLKDKLEGQGYTVHANGRAADPSVHYIISGF